MRLIDADKMRNKISAVCLECIYEDECDHCDIYDLREYLDCLPTIDPIKHGHWIDTQESVEVAHDYLPICECSVCHEESVMINTDEYNYFCGWCGAKMNEVDDEAI